MSPDGSGPNLRKADEFPASNRGASKLMIGIDDHDSQNMRSQVD